MCARASERASVIIKCVRPRFLAGLLCGLAGFYVRFSRCGSHRGFFVAFALCGGDVRLHYGHFVGPYGAADSGPGVAGRTVCRYTIANVKQYAVGVCKLIETPWPPNVQRSFDGFCWLSVEIVSTLRNTLFNNANCSAKAHKEQIKEDETIGEATG